jgi:small GTP-binding protein
MLEKAQHLIHLTKEQQFTTLNLSGCRLTEIPEEVAEMVWLEELDLAQNQISDLELLKRLINLKILWLYQNQIKDLEPISGLVNLQKIELSLNQISELNPLKGLENLQALGLDHNPISDLNPLKGLSNLQTLDLKANQVSDLSPIADLENLQSLGLDQNQVSDLSPLKGLSNLLTLELAENSISDLFPLKELDRLQSLDLSKNQISDLRQLKNLSNLRTLDLSQNQINDIDSLANLVKLNRLQLYQNQISDLKPLVGLHNLQTLRLSQNQISDIGPLTKLFNLGVLWLDQNQISDLQPLSTLVNLKDISLDQNQISDLQPLAGLIKTEFLSLNQNHISNINPLVGLASLQALLLTQNQVSDISLFANLSDLRALALDQNKLPSLAKIEFLTDKSKYKDLTHLSLFGNPMNGIDEKILGDKKHEDVLSPLRQFFSQYKKGKKRLFEAKLILVGEGGVGKTSLKQKLKFNQYQAKPGAIPSTEGILSEPWDLKGVSIPGQPKSQQVRLNIWDFGGQEIDHQTHQFFLTKSSVYLFVSNSRLGDTQSKFDYWLNIIHKLAPDSPVLVVRNLFDNQKEPFRFEEWRQKYVGQINPKSVTVACTQRDDKGIDQVLDFIRKSLPELENFGVEWPLSYVEIRHELEALALNELNYIPFDQYADICSRHGLETDEEAETLAAYLHNIGTILHYQEDPVLRELVILNPQWLTGAFYKIIRDEGVNKEKGLFTRSMLKEIWDRKLYPSDKYPQLIELMMKFELCFPLEQRNHYIIPQLLQEAENKEARKAISGQDTLRFQYHYDDVLPAGMISRFICKQHGNIAKDAEGNFLYWRYGVLIQREETLALIEQPIGDTKILVTVQGKHKRELLAVIRDCFDQLHRPLNNLKPVEILPCNCEVCAKSKDPHPFKYEVIKRRLNDPDVYERCDISDAKVNRRTLYADAIDETYIDKERIKALIASGQIDKVMQDYGTDHRFFDMKMRYGILSNEHFIGTLTTDEYLARKMQVAQGLLENLDRND